jgi:hypothetical protein
MVTISKAARKYRKRDGKGCNVFMLGKKRKDNWKKELQNMKEGNNGN